MPQTLNRRTVLASLAAGLGTASLAQNASAQNPGGSVVIYTSNSAQAVEAVTDVAGKILPTMKISTVTGGSGQLLRRIEAEAAKPQGDVFWSSSANTLGAFKALYEPYRPTGSDTILESLRDPTGLWTACNIHVAVMMVNKNQLGGLPVPVSWTDLRDRRWKGKVIIADPANSSTAYTILWGLEQLFGRGDAFKEFADNVKVTSSAPTVLRGVAQGEYAVGLTFEANAYTYVAGGQSEIALAYPGDGTFTTAEYLALIKGAPAGAAAKQVCDLLVSREAQVALLESAFRRPSRTDIEVGKYVKLPELSKIKVFQTNEDDAAAQRKDFLTRWRALATAN
jgi:iron(III) transport system substrate-binding protein